MIKFNVENTAIDTKHSKSASKIVEMIKEGNKLGDKLLDYGCGTGRNIRYIMDKTNNIIIDGTDIIEQLKKQHDKHDILRKKGVYINVSNNIKNNYYNYVLCSHVLNVIESDDIKLTVLQNIHNKLVNNGIAIIEVRTKNDVESAKTKEKYGNGYKIKKGNSFTYQEAITKEKMETLVKNAGFEILEHIFNASNHIIIIRK